MELRGAELENYGVEPRREADESKGEDYVYGQSNSGVGARVESLFLVDEECNYLTPEGSKTLNAMKSASPQR